jgi:hypothetical protein
MITNHGEHKITVEVELKDGTVVRHVVKFSGGNPLFHAKETVNAAEEAVKQVAAGIAGMYGDIRGRER